MDNSFDDKDIILRLQGWNLGVYEGKQKKNEDFCGNLCSNQKFFVCLQRNMFVIQDYIL